MPGLIFRAGRSRASVAFAEGAKLPGLKRFATFCPAMEGLGSERPPFDVTCIVIS